MDSSYKRSYDVQGGLCGAALMRYALCREDASRFMLWQILLSPLHSGLKAALKSYLGTDGTGPTQGFLLLMCTKLCKILTGMLAFSRLVRENLIRQTDCLDRLGDSCIKKCV